MKRVFGIFEAVFDVFYLIAAFIIGLLFFISKSANNDYILAGVMALVLVCGDGFHLVPRVMVILTHQEERLRPALGRGKQITSISMTVFYLLLWQIGLSVFLLEGIVFWTVIVYLLAAIRIALCLFPQNKWLDRYPPIKWGIWRNIPFFILGAVVAVFYLLQRNLVPGLGLMWLAILLSFGFYLPVVLWSNRNPKIGMLMLPKTCAYLWMLVMCFSL